MAAVLGSVSLRCSGLVCLCPCGERVTVTEYLMQFRSLSDSTMSEHSKCTKNMFHHHKDKQNVSYTFSQVSTASL